MARKKIARPEADRIKSILITKTAIKELISEDIVEKVISFQFKDFRDAIYEHSQVEISGFGKFMISPNKVEKQKRKAEMSIQKFKKKQDTELDSSDTKKQYWEAMIKISYETLEYLKTRTSGYENKH